MNVFYKTGQTTGTTRGAIKQYFYSYSTSYAGTLRYVFLMTNTAESGDSGSPVYRIAEDEDEGNFAKPIGIISGKVVYTENEEYIIVVSITAIEEDLYIVLDSFAWTSSMVSDDNNMSIR